MNYRTRKVSEIDVDGLTAELSFEPSCVMSYMEHKIEKQGGLVAVGYLVDDHDVENPLDDCDGMGHIYSSHRHSGQHAKMQAVLGLDSDWQRDLSLRVVEREAESALMELVRTRLQVDLVAFILECANNNEMSRDQAIEYFVVDFTGQLPYHRETWLTEKVRELVTWNSLLDDAWQLARLSGQVGDPYTVMLDCYEHGDQVWSVTGSGPQCLFDTARGAGVWVPDQCLRDELDSIKTNEGIEAARTKAVEFALQALGSYNSWLAGDCYGVAVDVFLTEGDRLKLIDESAVWGYVGRKWAEESLSEEVRAVLGNAVLKAA
ncbi:hypothetical protein [Thiobacillus denitrificans]|uniref:hypothetical protein n=1 Tax=Thiobacillus denitrificans TaxID=36861 RepID=UPI00037183D1|nr:hypothetical protein [Thiobacillus denitrificans]